MTVEPDLSGAVVLVVHAHPDDEVFAAGAATIAASEAGAPEPFSPAGPGPASPRLTHVLVATPGVRPHVLVHTQDPDPVEPVLVVDQDPLALGQDRVVGRVPPDAETLSDPGDREVLDHDRLQSPPQPAARELRARLGSTAGVLAPHVSTTGAPVAANREEQCRGSPPERLVGQSRSDCVARGSLAAAPSAPPLIGVRGFHDATRQHRPARLESLAGHEQTELVETTEGGQVSSVEPSIRARAEGNVRHVEVFQMDSVRTSILGRPRPLSRRDAPTEVVHDGVTRPHPQS